MNTKTQLFAILALLLSLAACIPASGAGGAETPVPPTEVPVEQPTEAHDAPAVPNGLLGVWYWLAFEDSADGAESNDIAVSDPTKYTLEFLPDGTYTFQADCNQGGGAYSTDGSSLTFLPGPATLAECEPNSLYDVFLARLGDVVTYVFDEGGELVLNLRMDAGNMIFGREGRGLDVLEGSSWNLIGRGSTADLTPPLPNTEITLDLADGQVSGSAGCNRYFADYTVTIGGKLQIGLAGSTMMACQEEIMQQEIEYLATLATAESFTLDGESLTIHTGEDDLVFEAAQELTLEGRVWTLSGIAQNEAVVSTALDNKISAEFSGEHVTGSAGCNSYFASYETKDFSLSLGAIGATTMICDDETNQREAEFLSALESVAGYDISRNTLTLTDSDGNVLVIFQAQGETQE